MKPSQFAVFAEVVAQRVVEILEAHRETGPAVINADPLMNRCEAAKYLSRSPRTFDRERKRRPLDLKPARDEGPLSHQWRKSTLDMYKFNYPTPKPAAHKKAA